MRLGETTVVVALGIDTEGRKRLLGLREGATENAAVVNALVGVQHPGAAASLREGLEETLTLHRLALPGLLRLSLASTTVRSSPHPDASDGASASRRSRRAHQRACARQRLKKGSPEALLKFHKVWDKITQPRRAFD